VLRFSSENLFLPRNPGASFLIRLAAFCASKSIARRAISDGPGIERWTRPGSHAAAWDASSPRPGGESRADVGRRITGTMLNKNPNLSLDGIPVCCIMGTIDKQTGVTR